mmetsp:Transcript_31755/g.75408  ORF Transcript_31755/g.75408 Transcript_31755/m.75408 type:complete len:276 (-) Transcript_31755:1838-2665(-)
MLGAEICNQARKTIYPIIPIFAWQEGLAGSCYLFQFQKEINQCNLIGVACVIERCPTPYIAKRWRAAGSNEEMRRCQAAHCCRNMECCARVCPPSSSIDSTIEKPRQKRPVPVVDGCAENVTSLLPGQPKGRAMLHEEIDHGHVSAHFASEHQRGADSQTTLVHLYTCQEENPHNLKLSSTNCRMEHPLSVVVSHFEIYALRNHVDQSRAVSPSAAFDELLRHVVIVPVQVGLQACPCLLLLPGSAPGKHRGARLVPVCGSGGGVERRTLRDAQG